MGPKLNRGGSDYFQHTVETPPHRASTPVTALNKTNLPQNNIGGPDSKLPFVVESCLCWSLCLFYCPAVWGYHYVKSLFLSTGWYRGLLRRSINLVHGILGDRFITGISAWPDLTTWIPLVTHSRAEIDRSTAWGRYLALVRVLETRYPETLTQVVGNFPAKHGPRRRSMSLEEIESMEVGADAELLRVLRQDTICRRLASLAMRPFSCDFGTKVGESKTITLLEQFPHNRLLRRIKRLWPMSLELPTLSEAKTYYRRGQPSVLPDAVSINKKHTNVEHYSFRISLVLPAYHEKGGHILKKLSSALEAARDPSEVEVVVVNAGGCSDLDELLSLTDEDHGCGRVSIYSFEGGGGRGPCLNYGATQSTGRILTFCHSDTTLPRDWDKSVVATLEHNGMRDDELSVRSNSCSFSFGIDTSEEGLSMPFDLPLTTSRAYYPPGIKAAVYGANIRAKLFSLPYGDQAMSIHACVFDFLGGFPDQCMMEDYDFVSLLRRRARLVNNGKCREKVSIIRGPPALCSPRRWQKFGVFYVTCMNTYFVHLYAGMQSADELYRLYYSQDPPERKVQESPWEVELKKILD